MTFIVIIYQIKAIESYRLLDFRVEKIIKKFAQNKGSMALPLEEGDYYYSEEGFIVFTKQYHLKRGYCCQSGCKHCPYGFDKRTGRFNRKKG